MAYCGWARQGELPVRPGRVLESEEPVHPPAAIRLPQQEGDVPPELRPAQAARVAPGLLEGAELRRVIRRDATRRDGETEVHILERRPVAPRHRRQLGGAPHRVEGRPLEHRGVGVQRGLRLGVVAAGLMASIYAPPWPSPPTGPKGSGSTRAPKPPPSSPRTPFRQGRGAPRTAMPARRSRG